MPKIEMYTKALCPFCFRAKALLRDKNAQFEEFDISMNPGLRNVMMDRASGRSTVPQIFIDGRHIGGCDDLMALDARGGLDPLLIPA
jgi:glutaredoxin 3